MTEVKAKVDNVSTYSLKICQLEIKQDPNYLADSEVNSPVTTTVTSEMLATL